MLVQKGKTIYYTPALRLSSDNECSSPYSSIHFRRGKFASIFHPKHPPTNTHIQKIISYVTCTMPIKEFLWATCNLFQIIISSPRLKIQIVLVVYHLHSVCSVRYNFFSYPCGQTRGGFAVSKSEVAILSMSSQAMPTQGYFHHLSLSKILLLGRYANKNVIEWNLSA